MHRVRLIHWNAAEAAERAGATLSRQAVPPATSSPCPGNAPGYYDVALWFVRSQDDLAAGLVDYKVAAIDDTWSGLLFTRRKST